MRASDTRSYVDNDKSCFIIAPIGEPDTETRKRSDEVTSKIIDPVVTGLGYSQVRADKMSEPGIIGNQVIQTILKSSLVLADLTERNPNVFYELAIRHMVRKPLVHVIKEGEKIPFDVAGIRIIRYPYPFEGPDIIDKVDAARDELKRQIQSMQKEKFKMDTPISAAIEPKELIKLMQMILFYGLGQLIVEIGSETNVLVTENNVLGLKDRCRWIHVRVKNPHPEQKAQNCFANVSSIKDLTTGNERTLNSGLKWEDNNQQTLMIPPESDKQFDAVIISHENPSKAFLGLNWLGGFFGANRERYTLEGPGDFEITFAIYSDTFPDVKAKYRLHIADRLEDVEFQEIRLIP